MKEFKKVELIAKNLPTGSYAAGCPADTPQSWGGCEGHGFSSGSCKPCEVSQ